MPRPDDELDDDRPRRRSRDDDDDRDRPPPRRKSNVGLILGIIFGVLFVLCAGGGVAIYFAVKGAAGKISDAADRMNSSNNLKQIGLGVLEYEGKNSDYPANSYGPDGKPLLSWRVHILPFVDEDPLYRRFKLDEPWDSPRNLQLLDQMPQVYASPAERAGRTPRGNKTYYRGFAGGGGAFSRRDAAAIVKGGPKHAGPAGKLGLLDFSHGMALTPIVVEGGDPIEWTKPDDYDLSPGKPFPNLGGIRSNDPSFMVLFADGSVRAVRRTVPEAEWRKAVDVKGAAKPNLD